MKVSLFPFQEIALKNLRINTAEALDSYSRTHTPQVISFTAPTGAGKTIIMTTFIENILFGDEYYPEQTDAIFVWLSDSPELNEQSKLKIDTKADKIRLGQCVTVTDDNFDREFLEDGHVYFLNTQKLGKSSNLTKQGDSRQYTIWETLRNTAHEKSDRLYFIIDEAHRGMKDRDAAKATTIMQKFLKGSDAEGLSPMPVVIGMSATSERFNRLVEGTSSTIHKVVVHPEDVRSSGLLKDRIVISYSEESSVNKTMAILQAAADDFKHKWDHWHQYCYEQGCDYVNPIFVIQVENGSQSEVSATDLDNALLKIEERMGKKFSKGEVVHTFGETDSSITIAGLEVPYEEPSRIQDNKNIKIVFFKENLSTGWDCPRAETMMSFRHAKDATYIAQLLGRMVRTPMQMRIQVDDTLNDVHLYLPFFEKETVEDVIEALQSEEGGSIPTDIYGESIEHKKLVTWSVRPKSHTKQAPVQIPGQQELNLYPESAYPTAIQPMNTNTGSSGLSPLAVNPIASTTTNSDEKRIKSSEQAAELAPSISIDTQPDAHAPGVPASLSANDTLKAPSYKTALPDETLPDIDREAIIKAINDSGLLTYNVRSTRINDYVKSMFSFARLLNQTGMDTSALAKIHHDIITMIADYVSSLKEQHLYERLVEKVKSFKLSTQIFDVFGKAMNSVHEENSFYSTDIDIDRQFRVAETRLGSEGIGNSYLNAFFDPVMIVSLKIDVILYAANDENFALLSRYAQETYHRLNDQYRRYMTKLADSYRKQYDRIVSDGDVISKHNLRLPETINVTYDSDGRRYNNHLFVNDDGFATIKLNDWEQSVLAEEMRRDDFVCWLRNPPRASWSLCIPYEIDGETKPAYPDFLIIRKDTLMPGGFVIDVLEPHNPAFNDNLGKAKGFAEYARQNPGVGRIELIRKAKDPAGNARFKRLDMSMSSVRDKVLQAMSDEELNHIFDTDGKFE